jgi:hypothetical protein
MIKERFARRCGEEGGPCAGCCGEGGACADCCGGACAGLAFGFCRGFGFRMFLRAVRGGAAGLAIFAGDRVDALVRRAGPPSSTSGGTERFAGVGISVNEVEYGEQPTWNALPPRGHSDERVQRDEEKVVSRCLVRREGGAKVGRSEQGL